MALTDKENVPVDLVVSFDQEMLDQSLTMILHVRLTMLLIPVSQHVAYLIKHDLLYKVTVQSVLDFTLPVLCIKTRRSSLVDDRSSTN